MHGHYTVLRCVCCSLFPSSPTFATRERERSRQAAVAKLKLIRRLKRSYVRRQQSLLLLQHPSRFSSRSLPLTLRSDGKRRGQRQADERRRSAPWVEDTSWCLFIVSSSLAASSLVFPCTLLREREREREPWHPLSGRGREREGGREQEQEQGSQAEAQECSLRARH